MKDQLASTNMDEKKDALKKVIALMTVGQDVSKLFMISLTACSRETLR